MSRQHQPKTKLYPFMAGETSTTWLQELRASPARSAGWRFLIDSYGPFVTGILIRRGVDRAAAEDISQDVLTIVWKKIGEFERQRTGSFRTWLRAITINCFRDYQKSKASRRRAVGGTDMLCLAAEMEDPHGDFTRIWNSKHTEHLLDELIKAVTPEFTAKSIDIFRRLAIQRESVEAVATELGMTKNACIVSRSRVFKRLKQVAAELFADEDVFPN